MAKKIIQPAAHPWTWIDLENPSQEELQALAEEYQLHASSVQDCLQPGHLPKFELINGIVFIIVRVHNLKAHQEADTIQELTHKIAIFYSENFLITLHRPAMPLCDQLSKNFTDPEKTPRTLDLLLQILESAIKTYEIPAQRLIAELDFYEAKTFLQRKIPPLTKGLYHLKRKAAVAKKVLKISEVILTELKKRYGIFPALQELSDLHLQQETNFDEIRESAINLMNMYISMSSQKTNEVMRVLTVFSVFFMPLTFIAGIYGMNFSFMPELKAKMGYPMAMLAMIIISVFIYFWFRRKGWI